MSFSHVTLLAEASQLSPTCQNKTCVMVNWGPGLEEAFPQSYEPSRLVATGEASGLRALLSEKTTLSTGSLCVLFPDLFGQEAVVL